MKTLYVALPAEAFDALRRLAARELRHPRQQAARLILDGLRRELADARPGDAAIDPAGTRARDA